MCRTF